MHKTEIDKQWVKLSKCIPKSAPQTQFLEMEKAFYSGAFSMMNIIMNVSHEEISDDELVKHTQEMALHIYDYLKELNERTKKQIATAQGII